ncbi:uncharacterized protein METZ01_LOCUS27237, partial [marine metagenome]
MFNDAEQRRLFLGLRTVRPASAVTQLPRRVYKGVGWGKKQRESVHNHPLRPPTANDREHALSPTRGKNVQTGEVFSA